jgi:hypothetical protein
MWALKIYGLMWLLVAAAAGVFYLTDSFTYAVTMVLGFAATALGGAGLLVVYPILMSERVRAERSAVKVDA